MSTIRVAGIRIDQPIATDAVRYSRITIRNTANIYVLSADVDKQFVKDLQGNDFESLCEMYQLYSLYKLNTNINGAFMYNPILNSLPSSKHPKRNIPEKEKMIECQRILTNLFNQTCACIKSTRSSSAHKSTVVISKFNPTTHGLYITDKENILILLTINNTELVSSQCLNKLLNKALQAKNTDYSFGNMTKEYVHHLRIEGLMNYQNKCHMLLKYRNYQLEIEHVIHCYHNIDDNELVITQISEDKKITQVHVHRILQMDQSPGNVSISVDQRLLSNETTAYAMNSVLGGFLEVLNNLNQLHPIVNISKYNNKKQEWSKTSILNEKIYKKSPNKPVSDIILFGEMILIENNIILKIHKNVIYKIDILNGGEQVKICDIMLPSTTRYDDIHFHSLFFENSQYEKEIIINGYVRNLKKELLKYPPQYLLKIIILYYCSQTLYLMRYYTVISNENDETKSTEEKIQEKQMELHIWELDIDTALTSTSCMKIQFDTK